MKMVKTRKLIKQMIYKVSYQSPSSEDANSFQKALEELLTVMDAEETENERLHEMELEHD